MIKYIFIASLAYLSFASIASADEAVLLKVINEVDLTKTIICKSLIAQDIQFKDDGSVLFARVFADDSAKLLFYEIATKKLRVIDCGPASRQILPRPNLVLRKGIATLAERTHVMQVDTESGHLSTLFAFPRQTGIDCPYVQLNDKLLNIYSLSDGVELKIFKFDMSTNKITTGQTIKLATAFCSYAREAFYATQNSMSTFSVHMIEPDTDRHIKLFSEEGPKCSVLGVSAEYLVAGLVDGSLRVYDRATMKTLSIPRVVMRSISSCAVIGEMAFISSFDRHGKDNVVVHSCKNGKRLGGLDADSGGIYGMSVDSNRKIIAVLGTDCILRLISYQNK